MTWVWESRETSIAHQKWRSDLTSSLIGLAGTQTGHMQYLLCIVCVPIRLALDTLAAKQADHQQALDLIRCNQHPLDLQVHQPDILILAAHQQHTAPHAPLHI